MARPKKIKTETAPVQENVPIAEVQPVIEPIKIYDVNRLLKSVDYILKPNGKIDWRKMISKEHIVLNKFNLACRGIDVDTLQEDAKEKLLEESQEEDLVIKLAGFREIADMRGFSSIDSEIVSNSENSVSIKVTINWVRNYENEYGLRVSAIANASRENTDEKFAKYLDTIAENRAFVRAVRHSLGIVAVGQDEIKQEDVQVQIRNTKVHSLLIELMQKTNMDLDSLKIICAKEGFEWDDKWISVEKIDPATVITIIPIIKQLIG